MWDSDPFGATPADEDPDGDSTAFTYNLRFPGQYFDEETGLSYNYFRDYDAVTGRYVESDPIGLGGGLNTYAYAGSNPVIYFDVFGLACNARGCYPTPLETAAAVRGDWREYYALACAGHDEYACQAGKVARGEGFLSWATTSRLEHSISSNLPDDTLAVRRR